MINQINGRLRTSIKSRGYAGKTRDFTATALVPLCPWNVYMSQVQQNSERRKERKERRREGGGRKKGRESGYKHSRASASELRPPVACHDTPPLPKHLEAQRIRGALTTSRASPPAASITLSRINRKPGRKATD